MVLGVSSNPSHYIILRCCDGTEWIWSCNSVREFEAGRVLGSEEGRVLAELLKVKKIVKSGVVKVTQARTEVHLLV